MYNPLLRLLVLILLYLCAHAEVTATADDPVEVIEVINQQDIGSASYQVLYRDDFTDTSQTLADVLQTINGIQIRQISGIGNPVAISIRGSNTKQVQLYIDGQLINDGQFGGFDLNQIPTEQIESIEISKNQAIGTGTTPIGGVIRINTYNPTQQTTKFTAGIGSFGYQEFNFLNNTRVKTHQLSFGGHYLASDNDYDYLVPQSFNNSSESIVEALRNNDFLKKTLFVNGLIEIVDHQIRFNAQYNSQEKAIPNYQNNSPENISNLSSDGWRLSYQHVWQSDLLWLELIEFELYNDDKDERYLASADGVNVNINDYNSSKESVAIKPLLIWNDVNITPFFNYNKQKFSSKSQRNGENIVCNGITACDVAAQQQQYIYGARLEWQSTSTPLTGYLLVNNLREKNRNIALNLEAAEVYKNSKSYQTKELGLGYHYNNWQLTMNVSDGTRTPTLFELFGDRGLFKANNNLLPEEARTFSFGSVYKSKKLAFSSAIYQKELANSIVAIFNSSGIGTYSNVNNADLSGIELQLNYQLFKALSLLLQTNLIDSSTTSDFVAFDNKKLPGIYHQQYSIAWQFEVDPQWKILFKTSQDKELYFNLVNKFENTSGGFGGGNPANRTIADLSVLWGRGKHRIALSVNNLFDQAYQDLANRAAQGRNIQLKYTVEGL